MNRMPHTNKKGKINNTKNKKKCSFIREQFEKRDRSTIQTTKKSVQRERKKSIPASDGPLFKRNHNQLLIVKHQDGTARSSIDHGQRTTASFHPRVVFRRIVVHGRPHFGIGRGGGGGGGSRRSHSSRHVLLVHFLLRIHRVTAAAAVGVGVTTAAAATTTATAVAAAVHMKSIFVHRWCKIKHGQDSKCRLCRFIERHNDTLLFVAKPVHTIKDSTRQFFQVFNTVLGGRLD